MPHARRKVSHATKQRERKRKPSRDQQARLDAVFAKQQSNDVDPLDSIFIRIDTSVVFPED
jgi:hypothetical protein